MLIAALPFVGGRVARGPIHAKYGRRHLVEVGRRLCHRVALRPLVRGYLAERGSLVPLVRADCVCHLAEFAGQSLRSRTWSTCAVVDSCILAILRERSLRALIALSTSIGCAHHDAATCDRLLRARLPNFLSIVQTLILRTQRSSQWLKSKKSVRVEICPFWVLTLPFPSVFLDMLRSLFLLLLALLFELSDVLLCMLALLAWLALPMFTSEELPL